MNINIEYPVNCIGSDCAFDLHSLSHVMDTFDVYDLNRIIPMKYYTNPDLYCLQFLIDNNIRTERYLISFDGISDSPIKIPDISVLFKRNPVFDEIYFLWNKSRSMNLELDILKRISLMGTCRIRASEARVGPDLNGNIFIFPPSNRIMGYLDHFCEYYNYAVGSTESVAINSFSIMANFLSIHPFVDGNGRIARTLLQSALMKCIDLKGPILPLTLVTYINASKYISCIRDLVANGNWSYYILFMDKIISTSLDLLLDYCYGLK